MKQSRPPQMKMTRNGNKARQRTMLCQFLKSHLCALLCFRMSKVSRLQISEQTTQLSEKLTSAFTYAAGFTTQPYRPFRQFTS